MKKFVPIILFLFFLVLNTPLFSQEFGQITGRVIEAETGMDLAGANVYLESTLQGSASDIQGKFVISRVPAGNYTLVVSYLGYEQQSKEVDVKGGDKIRLEFQLQPTIIAGEVVEVWGSRAKGQALALNQQKNAANIKNIVASDQMGRFPDASAPDAVQRIPGISVQRDQGEGRYIQIRGGSPRMTSVSFNGERVPSPEGDDRQIALDAVPVNILESIEVSKAITPDMDADAIGGAVNLVTKRAPDSRLFQIEATGGYSTIREKYYPSGSVTYGDRYSNGKLGLLMSASASRRDFGSDDVEPDWELEDPGLADDQLSELEVRYYSLWRARFGGTAMLDYKFDENSFLYLNGIYSELQDEEQRRRLVQVIEDGELEFNHKNRLEKLKSMNLTVGGEHLFGSGSQLDYHLTYTKSEEDTPYDTEIAFLQENVTFNPDISDKDNVRANPGSAFINGEYIFDKIEPASSLTEDIDYVGALNFTLPYRFANAIGKLKIGFKYRDKKKTQDVSESAYELVDGADDLILGQDIGSSFDISGFEPGDYPFPPNVTSPEEVEDFVNDNRDILAKEDVIDANVEDFEAAEKTLAFFVMSEINLSSKFMILPGIRYENTQVDATGYEYDSETEEITKTTADKSYSNIFPMIHFRYRLTPNTNLRAAFTSVIARPNYYDTAPYRLRDDEDLSLGNPNLDPTYAYNYDLMFEHYASTIGIISAGLFHKQIYDPIFVFTSENDLGGDTEQPKNGDSGTITGFELAAQRQLPFLPAPFNGLGVYFNYTYTTSEAKLPGGRDANFSGQPDHVYNFAVSYEKSGFSGQLSFNYHDKYVLEYGDEAETDLFVNPHLQIDLSASYQVSRTLNVFLEMVNLTNEPYRTYLGNENRPRQIEYYKTWGKLGIRYSM